MGLDMYLYVGQVLDAAYDVADIAAWRDCHEKASKFIFPSAEKLYQQQFDGLIQQIQDYYRGPEKKIPMKGFDMNAILSGQGSLQVQFVYSVQDFNSYREFYLHHIKLAEECLTMHHRYSSNKAEINRLLQEWSGEIPVMEYKSWRKVPAIHSFFLNRIQERTNYYFNKITLEDLHDLKSIIIQAFEHKDNEDKLEELFPMEGGVFYGSIEFDDYFWENMESTLETLNEMDEKFSKHKSKLVFYYGYSA
jgi:hypothetical protein